MNNDKRLDFKSLFPVSLSNTIFTVIVLLIVIFSCLFLHYIDINKNFISYIFLLSVFLVSRYTNGYLYGIISSIISVFVINIIFSFYDEKLQLSISEYLLIIMSMLIISIITSRLTVQLKKHDTLRIEAEKEKTRCNLLRAVSHDLRTPLTSILGASSAIIENDDILNKDERRKLLLEIKEDSGWLIRMVENLLSITRIDADNGAKITKQSEPCEEVIAESVTKFKNRFPDIVVIVSIPNELLMIPMDAVLIEQVIINLLENVIIHAKGATKIELSLYIEDNNAIFEVSDDGKGIDENILPHIFNGYFKQNYEEKSDKKKNMGIGLSVCNTIIKAHNGKMMAENKSTGGALFRFTLPIREEV